MTRLASLVKHFSVVGGIRARRFRNVVATNFFRPVVLKSAREIVTPFTPFMFSHHYLSFEIDEFGLGWLNPGSHNLLRRVGVSAGDIVYCRDDQLEQFCVEILPQIRERFVLLTGTGTPGGLPNNRWVHTILRSELLLEWFAQNQIHPTLDIRIFPQGVNLTTAPQVSLFMELSRFLRKREGLPLVPFVTVHPHLVSPVREIRQELAGLMDKRKGILAYLLQIARSRTVISPPGDRDDTFRHWECILLGSFPITNLTGNYKLLFEDNMIYCSDLLTATGQVAVLPKSRPDSKIGTVRYWRKQVEACRFPR